MPVLTLPELLDAVDRDRAEGRTIAFANGPCLMIRRSVYDAVGGHRAVRGSILEDTDLGQRVKAAGYRVLSELDGDTALKKIP